MSIASYVIIHTESGTEFQPTKREIWAWKNIRQIFAIAILVGVLVDIFYFNRNFPQWIWKNLNLFLSFALLCAFHKEQDPKPYTIDRTNQTITHRDKTISFDDLLHFTVEAATFRDKVVMVTKTTRIDLTGGLSTKKAEKLRDTLVEAIPFTLPRTEFFQSKVATS